MRRQGRIRKAGVGGWGGVLSVLGPIRKAGGGGGGGGGGAVCFRSDTKSGEGGGGGAACRTMIYIFVCARVRDSAWGVERGGGGRQLVPEGGISYEWGGGGGGAAAPPKPMLDPGLEQGCPNHIHNYFHHHI